MRLLKNTKTTTKLVIFFLILCVGAWATTCSAEGRTFTSFGGGTTVNRGKTEILEFAHTWPVANMKDPQWRIAMTLIGSSNDPRYQLDSPNNFCASGQYIDGFKRAKLGLGLVACQNTDVYISSHAGFYISADFEFKSFYIRYGHISNAGTRTPNSGRDFVMLLWKFY